MAILRGIDAEAFVVARSKLRKRLADGALRGRAARGCGLGFAFTAPSHARRREARARSAILARARIRRRAPRRDGRDPRLAELTPRPAAHGAVFPAACDF